MARRLVVLLSFFALVAAFPEKAGAGKPLSNCPWSGDILILSQHVGPHEAREYLRSFEGQEGHYSDQIYPLVSAPRIIRDLCPLPGLHRDASRTFSNDSSFYPQSSMDIQYARLDWKDADISDELTVARGQSPCPRSRWNTWTTGYGAGGKANGGMNFSVPTNYSLGGVGFGLDRWLCPDRLLGLHGSYGRMHMSRNPQPTTADLDKTSLGFYFLRRDSRGANFLDVTYLHDSVSSQRWTANGNAGARFKGNGLSLYGERSTSRICRWGMFQPYWALQYVYLNHGEFTETGAGPSNLVVADRERNSFTGQLGLRFACNSYCFNGWKVTPAANLQWVHEYLDRTATVNVTTPAASYQSIDLGSDWVVAGTGLTLARCKNRSIYLNYNVIASDLQVSHVGSGGLAWSW